MASLPYPDSAAGGLQPNGAERRRAERLAVLLPGTIMLLDGEFACAIEDISTTGARIVSDATLTVGRELLLRSSPLDELCSVAWVAGQAAGLEFIDEVPLGLVRQLRWHYDHNRVQHEFAVREMLRDWVERSC